MDTAAKQELLKLFSGMAGGDFTCRATGTDEVIRQANAMADRIEQRMAEQLDDMVSMTMSAFETTMSMGRLEQNVGVLDRHAATMAKASEKMSANINQVSQRVEQVHHSISHATEQSMDARQSVSRAVEAMSMIKMRVDDAEERVNALTVASREIDGILTVIKKISDQTNLLALNATIEAARAGEAGKGFAVVAGEVKQLSQQTRQATENIVEKIQRIQQDIAAITNATGNIDKAVERGNRDIGSVSERMQNMDSALQSIADEVKQITAATEEQAVASQEVATAVNRTETMVGDIRGIVDRTLQDTDALEQKLTSEIQEFANMNISGAILHLAKSDHTLWKKRLINMVLGRGEIDPATVADHHECRLGKWYDNLGRRQYGHHETFIRLEEPHEKVHTLGRRAVELFNNGDRDAAIAEVDAIAPLSDEVVRLLDKLIAETA